MGVAYQNLAFLQRQAGALPDSLATYAEARRRGVLDEPLAAHYGLALCEAGRATEALDLLLPLAGSRDPDTLNALGIACSDSGRPAEAVRVFERVASLDPENVEAYENLGIVRLRAGNFAGA